MKLKGNIEILLEKGEKPEDYLKIDGSVTVTHDGFSVVFKDKPNYDQFWTSFYSRVDFTNSYNEVLKTLSETIKGKDFLSLAKKTTIPELKLSQFVEFNEISDTNLRKLLRAYDFKVKISFADGTSNYGDFAQVYEFAQDKVRNEFELDTAYVIFKRTGINYATVRTFLAGGKMPLEKLSKVMNFNIQV